MSFCSFLLRRTRDVDSPRLHCLLCYYLLMSNTAYTTVGKVRVYLASSDPSAKAAFDAWMARKSAKGVK